MGSECWVHNSCLIVYCLESSQQPWSEAVVTVIPGKRTETQKWVPKATQPVQRSCELKSVLWIHWSPLHLCMCVCLDSEITCCPLQPMTQLTFLASLTVFQLTFLLSFLPSILSSFCLTLLLDLVAAYWVFAHVVLSPEQPSPLCLVLQFSSLPGRLLCPHSRQH